jgi:hypothetical protein
VSMFSAALWVSARVSRAGDDVLGIANFSCAGLSKPSRVVRKFVSAGRRNQHARRARSPITDSGEALVWDAASVLRSAVQWVLV